MPRTGLHVFTYNFIDNLVSRQVDVDTVMVQLNGSGRGQT